MWDFCVGVRVDFTDESIGWKKCNAITSLSSRWSFLLQRGCLRVQGFIDGNQDVEE